MNAPKAIVGTTNNSSRDKESGVRSGVVKISKSETTGMCAHLVKTLADPTLKLYDMYNS